MVRIEETLFRHVGNLQYIRNPALDYGGLERARRTIESSLDAMDIPYVSEPFTVDGFDEPFYNIDAEMGDRDKPVIYIGSHYDTAEHSPGANDNASGTAVMLALADLLKPVQDRVHVRLLFFTLEEMNPTLERLKIRMKRQLGIIDDQHRFTKLPYQEDHRTFVEAMAQASDGATSYAQQVALAYAKIGSSLSQEMRTYLGWLADYAKGFQDKLGFGDRALIGSVNWVLKNQPEHAGCLGMIDLDSVGYCNDRPGTQIVPDGFEMTQDNSHLVNLDRPAGNFITVIESPGADALAQAFLIEAKGRQLPTFHYACPYPYEVVAAAAPELLLADHAPFWKRGIPCLFLTDTGGECRYWYEHTPADTFDKLDFTFMGRITLALRDAIQGLFEQGVVT